jgi:hypothetical protein
MREEELRVVPGAQIHTLDLIDAGAAQGALGSRPEIETAVAGQVGVVPL